MSDVEVLCDWGENVHLYDSPCNSEGTIIRHVPFTQAIGDPSDRTKETYILCDDHAQKDATMLHLNPEMTQTETRLDGN